jgi:hypothetical protein
MWVFRMNGVVTEHPAHQLHVGSASPLIRSLLASHASTSQHRQPIRVSFHSTKFSFSLY